MHFDIMTNYCIYVEGLVTMQGQVNDGISAKGEFTLIKEWREELRVISDTIKYVHYNEATYCES